MDSYTKINGSSFLNYYNTNVVQQYGSQQYNSEAQTTGIEIEVDDTKKIGLIVNNNLIVADVIAKNYFPEPYYGIIINFVE